MDLRKIARPLALAHGGYYFLTGLWPVLHLRSFEKVTGPKLDGWLVKTVGALIAVVGATIAGAGWARRLTPEIRLLAMGSSAALGMVDVIYPAKGRISPVYFADAAPEAALLVGWLATSFGVRPRPRRPFRRPIAQDPKLATRVVQAAGMATTPAH